MGRTQELNVIRTAISEVALPDETAATKRFMVCGELRPLAMSLARINVSHRGENVNLNRGSEWRRWEPHIHAPGTVLNNQFGGGDAWTNYLSTLEGITPKIEAIAVTDYYVTDTYEEVLRQRTTGRLPNVQLIFANIEVRLDVAARSGFVTRKSV